MYIFGAIEGNMYVFFFVFSYVFMFDICLYNIYIYIHELS